MKKTFFLISLYWLGSWAIVSCEKNSPAQPDPDPQPNPVTEATVKTGEDWSFPSWVKPDPRSGYMSMDNFSSNALLHHVGVTMTWAQLNPKEGEYDFSPIINLMDEAKKKGKGMVLIRLKASIKKRKSRWMSAEDGPYMPQWVIDKHRPNEFYTMDGRPSNTEYLLYAAPWEDGVQKEYEKFVKAFGESGIFANDHFLGVYLCAFSSSYGEEFNLKPEFLSGALAAGMTPEKVNKTFYDRMDWWIAAAGQYKYKLIWVGAEGIANFDYDQKGLNDYAFEKGFGRRGGFIEHYFYGPVVPPSAAQRMDADGYVSVDWNDPFHDGRIYGDEAEEDDEYGDVTGEELRFVQESVFYQAARAGVNVLWTSDKNISWAREMAQWYPYVAGKGPRTSPDASCWLREAYTRGVYNGESTKQLYTWKNFERFLYQRDLPGAVTKVVERFELNNKSNDGNKDPGRRYECSARSTNAAAGQTKMVFRLDKEFEESLSGQVQIKVIFLDNSAAKWKVNVSTKEGVFESTEFSGSRNGQWRTATIPVSNIQTGNLTNGAAFEIELTGDADLIVKHVRVIRIDK